MGKLLTGLMALGVMFIVPAPSAAMSTNGPSDYEHCYELTKTFENEMPGGCIEYLIETIQICVENGVERVVGVSYETVVSCSEGAIIME